MDWLGIDLGFHPVRPANSSAAATPRTTQVARVRAVRRIGSGMDRDRSGWVGKFGAGASASQCAGYTRSRGAVGLARANRAGRARFGARGQVSNGIAEVGTEIRLWRRLSHRGFSCFPSWTLSDVSPACRPSDTTCPPSVDDPVGSPLQFEAHFLSGRALISAYLVDTVSARLCPVIPCGLIGAGSLSSSGGPKVRHALARQRDMTSPPMGRVS